MRLLLAAVLATSPLAASAQILAANAGVLEVVGIPPAQLGLYPYVGVSAAFTRTPFAVIPSLSLEASPDARRWGFVGSVSFDYALTGTLGLDLNLTLIHDQAGTDFAGAYYFLGAGPGLSLYAGRWTFSAWVSAFHGLNLMGWSIAPGINVAYAFAGYE